MSTEQNQYRNLDFRQNRIIRAFLLPMGAWPLEVLEGKIPLPLLYHRNIIPIMCAFMISVQIYYIAYNFGQVSFFQVGHVYINTVMTGVDLLSIVLVIQIISTVRDLLPCLKSYRSLVHYFYTTFDLEHFKQKGPNYEKINAAVYKISYYYAQIVMVMMILGMTLYNALPLYQNYTSGALNNLLDVKPPENGTLQFSVYYMFPGFRQERHFWTVTAINFYLTYLCSIPFCIGDLFLTCLVLHIIGHMKILMKNLNDIKMPRSQHRLRYDTDINVTVQLYDEEENKVIHATLIDCIEYHKFIINFTDDVSSLYGPVLAATYAFHLIGCCLLLLECSQLDLDAMMQYGPLTFIIFSQLIQLSVLFEFLETESEKISNVVYSVPWECMDVRNQRSLWIFLQRVQTPVSISALGIVEVGVKTMEGILRTTFYYFAFLQSIA